MLHELLTIFRSNEPLKAIGENFSAKTTLFSRLKHKYNFSLQIVLFHFQNVSKSQNDGRVKIMPTGVHNTVNFRRVR